MLYVFHVNGGRMLTFDMSSALDTVSLLKETIEKNCGIPTGNQVLLIGGGEILAADAKVFSYSAGTDSNPIFMFSTNNLQDAVLVPVYRDDHNFHNIIETALKLPATYNTVTKRAKIAEQLLAVDDEETAICERMVHEQHLQLQGWLAVVANMEDLTKEFTQRFHDFYATLDEHLGRRAVYHECLGHFEVDLRTLDRIPISASLVAAATGHRSFKGFGATSLNELEGNSTRNQSLASSSSIPDVFVAPAAAPAVPAAAENTETGSDANAAAPAAAPMDAQASSDAAAAAPPAPTESDAATLTLLQWLTARDAQSSLQNVAANCGRIIDMFDTPMLQQLKQTVEVVLAQAQQESILEIRGVAPRFMGLDELMVDVTKLLKENRKISSAFQHNKSRASDLKDTSILPDLCESHASQLQVMLKNHTEMSDYWRRIYMSKEELSNNLALRIQFMVQLENRMSELDATMLFFNRCLRRVQRHLVVIEQIHSAPTMYVQAIGEVVRRRTFAELFVKWSAELVQNWSVIYNEEVSRRQEFSSRFEGHFLSGLFTGLEDIPPAFAIDEPHAFDANLPSVSMNDLINLARLMPELAAQVAQPDLSTVVQFFAAQSPRLPADGMATQQQPPFTPKPVDMLSHLKDGCDSETDTEDFEKLDKLATPATISSTMATRSTSTERIETLCAETLTDECSADVERMRAILRRVQQACQPMFCTLRTQLAELKAHSIADREVLEQQVKELGAVQLAWHNICDTTRQTCDDQLDELSASHRRQLADAERAANAARADCAALRSENVDLAMMRTNAQAEAADVRQQMAQIVGELNERAAQLEQRLADAEEEKRRAVRETHEQLQRTHKTEVESLRSRFKLMAHMERSPSDTSLEKIERSECAEAAAVAAAAISASIPVVSTLDFASALSDSLSQTSGGAGVVQQQPRAASSTAIQSPGKSSVDVFRHILFTKEQELEQIRGGLHTLQTENKSLRDAIVALTQSATQQQTAAELAELRRQLYAEQARRVELEQQLLKSHQTVSSSSDDKTVAQAPLPTAATSTAIAGTAVTTTIATTVATTTTATTKPPKSSCSRRSISIDGCTKGDNVLVMWNPQHNQYTLLQDNPIIYFLHADSYAALHLEPPPPLPAGLNSASCIMTSCTTSTIMAASTTSPLSSLLTAQSTLSASVSSTSSPAAAAAAAPNKSAAAALTPAAAAAAALLLPPVPSPLEASAAAATMHRQWLFHDTQRQTPAVIGKLIDKEFCYARKDMNRYKVQRGAKFYRVKVAATSPTRCLDPTGKCCAKRARQEGGVVATVAPTDPAGAAAAAAAAPTITVVAATPAAALPAATASMTTTTTSTATPKTTGAVRNLISSFAQTEDDTTVGASPTPPQAIEEDAQKTEPAIPDVVVVLDGAVAVDVTDAVAAKTESSAVDTEIVADVTMTLCPPSAADEVQKMDEDASADRVLPRSISNASSETAPMPMDEN